IVRVRGPSSSTSTTRWNSPRSSRPPRTGTDTEGPTSALSTWARTWSALSWAYVAACGTSPRSTVRKSSAMPASLVRIVSAQVVWCVKSWQTPSAIEAASASTSVVRSMTSSAARLVTMIVRIGVSVSQVDLARARMGHDVGARPLHHHLDEVQHGDFLREVERHVHVVLDHHDRHVARDAGHQGQHVAPLLER